MNATPQRFAATLTATRLGLCAVREPEDVLIQHVAAVLAWTPGLTFSGGRASIDFDFPATAVWVAQSLDTPSADAEILAGSHGVLTIRNPHAVLGRVGLRDGRWLFRPGNTAALGIARGAVQAAAEFHRGGIRIPCPSGALMLTLVAVLRRLGVTSQPAAGQPQVTIPANQAHHTLVALGVPAAATEYSSARTSAAAAMRGSAS